VNKDALHASRGLLELCAEGINNAFVIWVTHCHAAESDKCGLVEALPRWGQTTSGVTIGGVQADAPSLNAYHLI